MIINYEKNHLTNALGTFFAFLPLVAIRYINNEKSESETTESYYSFDSNMTHMGIALANVVLMKIAFTGMIYALHKKGVIGVGTSLLVTNTMLCVSLLFFSLVARLSHNKDCNKIIASIKSQDEHQRNTNSSTAASDPLLHARDNSTVKEDELTENFLLDESNVPIKREDMQSILKDATLLGVPLLWPLLLITLLVDKLLINPLSKLCCADAKENSGEYQQV